MNKRIILLTLILLPIFISLNNQVKVISKWLIYGHLPTQESVERAMIEKEEEEKMAASETTKNNEI